MIMKKSYAFLLIALMFLFIPVTGRAGSTIYTTGDVNLRTGPGLDYSVYTSVKKGTTMEYLNEYAYDNRDVKWYKVYYNDCTLWVSSRFSTFSTPSSKVVTTGEVNLRWGPGKDYDIYGSVGKGKSMPYAGSSCYDYRGVKWYKVYYNGNDLWVSSRYSVLQ
jgi:N-acetylmuramoyl-L-alanine amidase